MSSGDCWVNENISRKAVTGSMFLVKYYDNLPL